LQKKERKEKEEEINGKMRKIEKKGRNESIVLL